MKTLRWQHFGEFLRHIRTNQGISQQVLAHKLGCSRIHLWRLEHDLRHPSRMFLQALDMEAFLDAPETSLLGSFKKMDEYKCDCLEIEEPLRVQPTT